MDVVFAGSIPELYERYMVPLIFAPYALDLAGRVAAKRPARVLEIAAGTGAVTRCLATALPPESEIVATDLNQPMLDHAAATGTARPVEWRRADAMDLPFPDGSFDAVVCQFGAMFFPDKARAFREARRVLRAGGHFIFNVWDRIEENEFADSTTQALARIFLNDPPRFMARIPHGYHDVDAIARDLVQGGFDSGMVARVVTERSRAESPRIAAVAYCQGTPLRNEIETRDPQGLPEATETVTAEIARRFGTGAVDGKIQALVLEVRK